jgi:hypothetical protein
VHFLFPYAHPTSCIPICGRTTVPMILTRQISREPANTSLTRPQTDITPHKWKLGSPQDLDAV